MAIKLNPNHANFYNNKGSSLYKIGKYDLAIKEYDAAIKLNPNDADFYHNKKRVEKIKARLVERELLDKENSSYLESLV